jgi:hypothetical protein
MLPSSRGFVVAPDHVVPVDLIVPKEIASSTGRRGARLPGGHGKSAAQKTEGVEGTLVDHDLIEIGALDAAEPRVVSVAVGGPAALIVAKAFKLGQRLDNPRRFSRRTPALNGPRLMRHPR